MRWSPAVVALSMVGAAACSASHQDGPAAADAGPGPDCRAFATVLCARRWECIPAAFEFGHGFGDAYGTEEVCVERTVLACQGWQRLPGTRATAEALASCTERIADLDCRTSTHTLTYAAA